MLGAEGRGFYVRERERETIMVFGNLTYYVNTCPIQVESVCANATIYSVG